MFKVFSDKLGISILVGVFALGLIGGCAGSNRPTNTVPTDSVSTPVDLDAYAKLESQIANLRADVNNLHKRAKLSGTIDDFQNDSIEAINDILEATKNGNETMDRKRN